MFFFRQGPQSQLFVYSLNTFATDSDALDVYGNPTSTIDDARDSSSGPLSLIVDADTTNLIFYLLRLLRRFGLDNEHSCPQGC